MTDHRIAVDCQTRLGECPLWHEAEQALYWVDIEGRSFWRHDPATGETRSWATPDRAGSFAFVRGGGFLLALPTRLVRWRPDAGAETMVDAMPGQAAGTRLNDGRCDRQGRFVVGAFDETTRQPIGGVWRLERDLSVTVLVETGVTCANAICFSPDGGTMYFADTPTGCLWAYDYDPEPGAPLGERRLVLDSAGQPGKPDGAVVDAEGGIWYAQVFGNRLARAMPDGTLDRTIDLPVRNPTCPCFGGPGLETLYLTSLRQTRALPDWVAGPTDGTILALQPGVRGLPETAFEG